MADEQLWQLVLAMSRSRWIVARAVESGEPAQLGAKCLPGGAGVQQLLPPDSRPERARPRSPGRAAGYRAAGRARAGRDDGHHGDARARAHVGFEGPVLDSGVMRTRAIVDLAALSRQLRGSRAPRRGRPERPVRGQGERVRARSSSRQSSSGWRRCPSFRRCFAGRGDRIAECRRARCRSCAGRSRAWCRAGTLPCAGSNRSSIPSINCSGGTGPVAS